MASTLSCVGLGVDGPDEFDALVGRVLTDIAPTAAPGELVVARWEDPSGARLILGLRGGAVESLLPSAAGGPGVRIASCALLNGEVATAAVVDTDGEQLTAMAFEPEQARSLETHGSFDGMASVVALGVSVEVHADADAFAASDASLLSPENVDEPAPAHYVERGLQWPPRYGHESFISYGLFGEASTAEPHAWLAGTVLAAERREVVLTGQAFIAARVRSVLGEVTVCMPADEGTEVPAPGAVIAGTVYLVGDLMGVEFDGPAAEVAPTHRWWQRGRRAPQR